MAKLLVEAHAHPAAEVFRMSGGYNEKGGNKEAEQAVHEQVRLGGCNSVTGEWSAVDPTIAGDEM